MYVGARDAIRLALDGRAGLEASRHRRVHDQAGERARAPQQAHGAAQGHAAVQERRKPSFHRNHGAEGEPYIAQVMLSHVFAGLPVTGHSQAAM